MLRRLLLPSLWLALALNAHAQDPIALDNVLLKLVEQVDVPAEQAGVLREVLVKAGDVVAKGDRLAQIDDAASRLTSQRAAVDLQMAERLARDQLAVDIATKSAEQARQKLQELRLQEQMAARQAENLLKVQAAGKAQAVAENELSRARRAKERFDDAVSQSEIDGRRLEAEKATLEAQQAEFEHELDALKLNVAREALTGQELAVGAADLETARAQAQHEVAQLQAELKRHELELAQLELSRRLMTSPLDGVVVDLYRQPGEWVEPGEPVLRILRLNRLWVEGFIRVEDLSKCVTDAPVTVTIPLGADEACDVEGRIVYVGREVDPVNREVLLRAEIPNENLRLLPGMSGRMTVLTERPVADASSTPRGATAAATAEPPARRTLEQRLEVPIEADLNAPLHVALGFVGERGNLAIEIDTAALKDAGLTRNLPVQLRVGRRTVREALTAIFERVLAQAGGVQLGIVYDRDRDVVIVTTSKFAQQAGRTLHPLTAAAARD